MPALVGLSYGAAAERAGAAGLKLLVSSDNPAAPSASAPPSPSPAPSARPAPALGPGVVIAQTPQVGRRVVRGAAIQIVVGHPAQTVQPQ
jgi:hypothetical protein